MSPKTLELNALLSVASSASAKASLSSCPFGCCDVNDKPLPLSTRSLVTRKGDAIPRTSDGRLTYSRSCARAAGGDRRWELDDDPEGDIEDERPHRNGGDQGRQPGHVNGRAVRPVPTSSDRHESGDRDR